MTISSQIVLASVIWIANVTSAAAGPEAWANCRTVVDETDYALSGGRLVERKRANLTKFPKGFLGVACEGVIGLDGIVQEDGSVLLSGLDHGVTCDGELDSGKLKRLGKSIWRGAVIGQRFQTSRYEPPRIAGEPVCVRIGRAWLPDAPHRFWSPLERAKHK